ncbi:MAG: hypothetical protein QF918_09165 [Pirellulaceae bacterium]|nr:hypothetical protein [Pirellulaceae bacterium]
MGRTYAGILGPLAFATVLFRGLILVDGVEPTLKLAIFCLFSFALVGSLIGGVAEATSMESVKTRIDIELQVSGGDASTPTAS